MLDLSDQMVFSLPLKSNKRTHTYLLTNTSGLSSLITAMTEKNSGALNAVIIRTLTKTLPMHATRMAFMRFIYKCSSDIQNQMQECEWPTVVSKSATEVIDYTRAIHTIRSWRRTIIVKIRRCKYERGDRLSGQIVDNLFLDFTLSPPHTTLISALTEGPYVHCWSKRTDRTTSYLYRA